MAAKRSKKSSKASKKGKAPARKGAKAARRPAAKAAKKASKRPAPLGKAGRGPDTRIRCAATDPFGGPCQNTPRLGSKYCGVHSHLEAMA